MVGKVLVMGSCHQSASRQLRTPVLVVVSSLGLGQLIATRSYIALRYSAQQSNRQSFPRWCEYCMLIDSNM